MTRARLTRIFLWIAILSWGIGLGAKVFDLVVLAPAWGASPPSSLALYPYGRHWPINPGNFFQPLSAIILLASLAALTAGWKTAADYRRWLLFPVLAFAVIWILTPTVFWPIINDLYAVASGKVVRSEADLAQLVRRWFLLDSIRVALILIGFVSSVRAISIPFAHRHQPDRLQQPDDGRIYLSQ